MGIIELTSTFLFIGEKFEILHLRNLLVLQQPSNAITFNYYLIHGAESMTLSQDSLDLQNLKEHVLSLILHFLG